MPRRPRQAFDKPLSVTTVEEEVVVTGPEHVHFAMTRDAAKASAGALAEAVEGTDTEASQSADAEPESDD